MLGAEMAQSEIARVQPGEIIARIPLHAYGKGHDQFELREGIIPEGSPLGSEGIDVIVATRGVMDADPHEAPRPYVIGRAVIEHTAGDAPAIIDVRAQLTSEGTFLGKALPKMLQAAHVRRARLQVERANVGASVISDAGFKRDDSGAFLIPAAA